jgi:hypothetical protein
MESGYIEEARLFEARRTLLGLEDGFEVGRSGLKMGFADVSWL